MKYLQIKLADDIHKRFKRKCLENDTEMSKRIRAWIMEYLKPNK